MSRIRPTTARQLRLLDIVALFHEENGHGPTISEVAVRLGVATATTQGHIDRSIKKGLLARGVGRGALSLTDAGRQELANAERLRFAGAAARLLEKGGQ